jgi:hypothetical protein
MRCLATILAAKEARAVADETPTDSSTVDLAFDSETGAATPASVTFNPYTADIGYAFVGIKLLENS